MVIGPFEIRAIDYLARACGPGLKTRGGSDNAGSSIQAESVQRTRLSLCNVNRQNSHHSRTGVCSNLVTRPVDFPDSRTRHILRSAPTLGNGLLLRHYLAPMDRRREKGAGHVRFSRDRHVMASCTNTRLRLFFLLLPSLFCSISCRALSS